MHNSAGSVAVPELQHGDTIHVGPHEVFRNSGSPWPVATEDADVLVDCRIEVDSVIVIVWHIPAPADDGHAHPPVLGATTYDADDTVQRLAVAA